ncbi:NADH dehydrogenase [ubiquinone] 1 beta subcomplex subunit 9 [Hetaerina americana]|uniref:NADH dehydrogenase [ubiquinone] 1 beta subcomplex subunit 9 n=1 Tax=Hetaerina americana TaxID=62018 RepID=UPI003A7F36BB
MYTVPLELVSHARRVCSLYKRSLRNLESWYDRRPSFRYEAVVLRERFDRHKNEKDMIVAKDLLLKGEQELLEKRHWQPKKFAKSPGGSAFERNVVPPDWVLDYWSPQEKAAYPDYFARREQRKKEYIQWWEKQYGKYTEKDSHH